jgi:hypothetical protein
VKKIQADESIKLDFSIYYEIISSKFGSLCCREIAKIARFAEFFMTFSLSAISIKGGSS